MRLVEGKGALPFRVHYLEDGPALCGQDCVKVGTCQLTQAGFTESPYRTFSIKFDKRCPPPLFQRKESQGWGVG